MRHTFLAVLSVLLLLTAVSALAGPGSDAAEAPAAESLEMSLEEILTLDAGESLDSPASNAQPASSCPFGGPRCVENDDCDEFCGDPAFGFCEIQGHFPDGCCSCLG